MFGCLLKGGHTVSLSGRWLYFLSACMTQTRAQGRVQPADSCIQLCPHVTTSSTGFRGITHPHAARLEFLDLLYFENRSGQREDSCAHSHTHTYTHTHTHITSYYTKSQSSKCPWMRKESSPRCNACSQHRIVGYFLQRNFAGCHLEKHVDLWSDDFSSLINHFNNNPQDFRVTKHFTYLRAK